MSIIEEINELRRKAGAYENYIAEYEPLVKEIKEKVKEIERLVEKLSPSSKASGKVNHLHIIDTMVSKMREDDSIQYNRDKIVSEFGISEMKASQVIQTAKKDDRIDSRKDGMMVYLFYKGGSVINNERSIGSEVKDEIQSKE